MRPRTAVRIRCAAVQANARASVQTVNAPDATKLINEGWSVLDVRPPAETTRLPLEGAVEAPLYISETRTDPVNMIKRFATWSNGGWWVGATHMIPNPEFAAIVESRLPKDKPVVVACQTGVRSLAACDQLARMGYSPLAWLKDGLEAAKPGELPTVPAGKDPRYGGIGGLSEAMGWTKVQTDNGDPQFLGGVNSVLLGVAAFLALDLLSILVGYIQVRMGGAP